MTNTSLYLYEVASHAGAWIETTSFCKDVIVFRVASHAGAWIETVRTTGERFMYEVASHAGAWIEICPESLNVVSRILKAIHNSKDVKERKVQVWSRRLSG